MVQNIKGTAATANLHQTTATDTAVLGTVGTSVIGWARSVATASPANVSEMRDMHARESRTGFKTHIGRQNGRTGSVG